MYIQAFRTGNRRPVKSDGFVLLLIVLTLLTISAAAFLTGLVGGGSAERRITEGATADQRLLLAKDALLGYAVGNIADSSGRPGQLLYPAVQWHAGSGAARVPA